jgi:hypothetical protein
MHKNIDMDFVGKVFVADIGMSEKSRAKISRYKKIEIIDTGLSINGGMSEIHTPEWVDSVWQKTQNIKYVLERTDRPLVFMDADTIICGDFAKHIDPEFDFQICKRVVPVQFLNWKGLYISSFFVFSNHAKSLAFIDEIRARMKRMQDAGDPPPFETRALNELIDSGDIRDWKIGTLWDEWVSCDNNCFEDTCISHYKSCGVCRDNSIARMFLTYLRRMDVLRANLPGGYWRKLRQCIVNPMWAKSVKL